MSGKIFPGFFKMGGFHVTGGNGYMRMKGPVIFLYTLGKCGCEMPFRFIFDPVQIKIFRYTDKQYPFPK